MKVVQFHDTQAGWGMVLMMAGGIFVEPQRGRCDHHTSVLKTECVAFGQRGSRPHKVSCHLPAGGWGWGRGWGWGEHMAVSSSLGCRLPGAATRMLFPQVRSCGPLLHSFVLAVTRLAGSVEWGVRAKRKQFSFHQGNTTYKPIFLLQNLVSSTFKELNLV